MKKTILLLGAISLLIIAGCGTSQTTTITPASTGAIGTTQTSGTTTPAVTPVTTPPVVKPTTPPSPPKIISKSVSISNFQFTPASVQISVGGSVHRKNNDNVPHQPTADDGSFGSAPLQPGDSYAFKFTHAGTYAYHCAIHPSMHGTILVK